MTSDKSGTQTLGCWDSNCKHRDFGAVRETHGAVRTSGRPQQDQRLQTKLSAALPNAEVATLQLNQLHAPDVHDFHDGCFCSVFIYFLFGGRGACRIQNCLPLCGAARAFARRSSLVNVLCSDACHARHAAFMPCLSSAPSPVPSPSSERLFSSLCLVLSVARRPCLH